MNFLNKMISENPEVSSKRIIGTLGFLFTLGLLGIGYFLNKDFSNNQTSVINTIMYMSGALLGIGVFKKGTNGNSTTY
jgi:hypothetical protein